MEETQLLQRCHPKQRLRKKYPWLLLSFCPGTSISVSHWRNLPGSGQIWEQGNAVPCEKEQGRKGRDGCGSKQVNVTAFTWPRPVRTPRQCTAQAQHSQPHTLGTNGSHTSSVLLETPAALHEGFSCSQGHTWAACRVCLKGCGVGIPGSGPQPTMDKSLWLKAQLLHPISMLCMVS